MDWTDEFRARVRAARACGVVHVAESAQAALSRAAVGEVAILSEPRGVADALARSLGFRALGRAWRELARDEAGDVLAAVLAHDLAYDEELMTESEARAFANEFLARFSRGARFFTNGEFRPRPAGLDPLTEATFDTGVAVVAVDCAALLWFEDED